MSLQVEKLQNVRRMANGSFQARCPACAEGGRDRKGEHLKIYPDGRFGCCVYPKDKEHRKRIYALAGDGKPKAIQVRVMARSAAQTAKVTGVMAKVGKLFPPTGKPETPAEVEDVVGEVFLEVEELRTARTSEMESGQGAATDTRTLRTGIDPLAWETEMEITHTCKGFADPVRGVRSAAERSPEKQMDLDGMEGKVSHGT